MECGQAQGECGDDTDTDYDGIPNKPEPYYPATSLNSRYIQEDCVPGNLVECFYSGGLMPVGTWNISAEEYEQLLLALSYDVNKQGPINNYWNRSGYDTMFYNNRSKTIFGTICVNGRNCRDRIEYNYIAQGAWSAAALEGVEGLIVGTFAWKSQYEELPTIGTLVSGIEGFFGYLRLNRAASYLMFAGVRNYYSGYEAYNKYQQIQNGKIE